MKKILPVLAVLNIIYCLVGCKIPMGTIVAWRPPAANIQTTNGLSVIVPPSSRWAVCNATNNKLNTEIPDLSDRFIMGTSNPTEIKVKGGTVSHTHTISPGLEPGDRTDGNSNNSARAAHTHTASSESNLPPFIKYVYIIKVK
jgi:hypothetical protein